MEVSIVFLFALIDFLTVEFAAEVIDVRKGFVLKDTISSTARRALELTRIRIRLYRIDTFLGRDVAAECMIFVRPTRKDFPKHIIAFLPRLNVRESDTI